MCRHVRACRQDIKKGKGKASGIHGYVGKNSIAKSKEERYPAYMGMLAKITFLGQLQLKLAVCIR
jgi:hypothetical protein